MSNTFFRFKQFTVHQQGAAMKVTTDACLFGAWVAQNLQKDSKTFSNLLDVGTGTGLLSLMLAQKIQATIDAVEIDEEAAAQALHNFNLSSWSDRLNLIEGDINTVPLPHYDAIISNPPFYENELASPNAQRNQAHHSSSLKLQGLVHILQKSLKEDGFFYLLLPPKRQKELEAFLPTADLYLHQLVWVHQTPRHAPFRMMLKGGKSKVTTTEKTIVIKDENEAYTPAFVDLLKEYYLYL